MSIGSNTLILSLVVIFAVPSLFGAESLKEVNKRLNEENKKIKVFEAQLAQGGETRLLEDLLFSLSESYQQKTLLMYNKKKLKNPDTPDDELDFSLEDREKQKSVDVLNQIVKLFPGKVGTADKALFQASLIKKSLGQDKEAIAYLKRIVDEYDESDYKAKAYLELGDFYTRKGDHEFAVDFYKKGLNKQDRVSFYQLMNKIGWSYIRLEKEVDAYNTFMDALRQLKQEKDQQQFVSVAEELLQSFARSYADMSKKEMTQVNPRKIPVERMLRYFSPGLLPYSKALKTATSRLAIKKRLAESAATGALWLNTERNMKDRIQAIYQTYESWKKARSPQFFADFVTDITSTFSFFSDEDFKDKKEKQKTQSDMELIARDYLTKTDQAYRQKNDKVKIDSLIEGYQRFIEAFPKAKKVAELKLNLAELLFARNRYIEAGQAYFGVAVLNKTRKARVEMLDAAVKAFILSLSQEKLDTRLQKLEARAGLRKVGLAYLKLSPKGPTAETVAFNYAQSFYRERDFKKATRVFWTFLKRYPSASQAPQVALLLLDSYDQMNQKKQLAAVGQKLLAANMVRDPSTRQQVKEIVEETIIDGGRSGVLGRNNNLLKLAAKYKGTSLGDKALYEAFVDLKAKRDPKAYGVGEQLISQHKDSKFARQVVSDMAKMAIITADLRKAATYFDLFGQKYPGDAEAKKLSLNAAEIYRELHDFKSAGAVYSRLGDHEMAAEMDLVRGSWSSLNKTCKRVGGASGSYYCGLAQFFMGNLPAAQNSLSSAVGSTPKDKSAAALYFLSLVKYKAYESLKMQPGRELETIQQKQQSLVELQALNGRLGQTGHPKWGLAGQFLMGRTNGDFNSFILSTPMPPRMPASAKKQLKQQLQQQAQPFAKSSKEFFVNCVRNAERYKVFNGAALGCARGQKKFDEKLLVTLNPSSETANSAAILRIQKKLHDKPRDISLYLQLAKALIKSRSGGEAAGVLSRAQTIDPKNPEVLALMGVAQVLLGNDQKAYDRFSEARKIKNTEPNALVGEYFLYNKYRYQNSQKKLSSLYKAASGRADFKIGFYR